MNLAKIGGALVGGYRTLKATAKGTRHGLRAGNAAADAYKVGGLKGVQLRAGMAYAGGRAALVGSVKKRAPGAAAHFGRNKGRYALGGAAAAGGGVGYAAGKKRERRHMMRGLR